MASFNYTVDTHPMAEEIRNVSRHVNTTTGAVVAMQAAMIAAEAEAADHICANVNKGFYSLIRSQISQKIARLQSEVDSHLMQLTQQSKAVRSLKDRMQRDYNMISSRYVKLFGTINNELRNRVTELDRPVMDFARKELVTLNNRSKYLTSTVPVTQTESLGEGQKIIASAVKQRGIQVIDSMSRFIHEMNVQRILTDKILIANTGKLTPGKVYLPIALYSSTQDSAGHRAIDVKMPAVRLDSATRSAINNMVYTRFDDLTWRTEGAADPIVVSEFNRLVQNSGASARVKAMAEKLYRSNRSQTI